MKVEAVLLTRNLSREAWRHCQLRAVEVCFPHDRRRARAQRLVDLASKNAAEDKVRGYRDRNDRDSDSDGGYERDSSAKGHSSRRTYPTPRTVWIMRSSFSASVFLRRYPMYTSMEFEVRPGS